MTNNLASPRSRDPLGNLLNREPPHVPEPVIDYLGGPGGGHGPANERPEPYSRGRSQNERRDLDSHVHPSEASLDLFDSHPRPKLSPPKVSNSPLFSKKTLPCPWESKTNQQPPEHIFRDFTKTHINIPPLATKQRARLRKRLPGIAHLLHPAASDLKEPDSTPQQQSSATSSSTFNKKFYCDDCKRWLGTKSELKKHRFRHLKPFYCDVSGCIRKDGFSTKNDLSRHKKSVHDDRSEDKTMYVCPFEHCGDSTRPKLWSRADNFRGHLRRVHNKIYTVDDNLREYVYQTPENPIQEIPSDATLPVRLEPVLTRTDRPHNSIILPGLTSQASASMRTVDTYLVDPSDSHIPETPGVHD